MCCPGLVATASVDWTAKLFDDAGELATLDHGNHAYVTDVAWAPHRAALLATSCSLGTVAVWSAADAAKPVAAPTDVSDAPLTTLAFADDGRRLAVGDANGKATVLAVDAALVNRDADEDARLDAILAARNR